MVGLPSSDGGHGGSDDSKLFAQVARYLETPASLGRAAASSFPCFRILAHPGATEQRLSQDKAERQLWIVLQDSSPWDFELQDGLLIIILHLEYKIA